LACFVLDRISPVPMPTKNTAITISIIMPFCGDLGLTPPQLLFQKLLVTSGHFRILLLAIGDDSLRQRAPLRVRVRVRRLGNPGYQFAEAATKLSIKDAFDAVRALTH